MKRPDFVLDIFLQPGDFHFGDAETSIRTVLGSCVSITMWHPQRLIGGMCHFMLPGGRRTAPDRLNGKYADEAIMMFMLEIAHNKTNVKDYEVKLFGGGNMFPGIAKKEGGSDIGKKNIDMAKALSEQHGLKIVAQDMGMTGHRNVIFEVWSGHVWVKHVSKVLLNTVQGNQK